MKSLWYALQRRWARDSDYNAGKPMPISLTAHPDENTTVEAWESGGTIGIRIGSYGQPTVSLLLGSDDGDIDFLCRLGRAVEDAMTAAREDRRRGRR